MTRTTTGRRHWLALALYLGLALMVTWPLVTHLSTHVTGDGIDDPALAWNLWWAKARLLEQLNPDLFHVDWMFHPIQVNLAFYTLTPLNGLLSIPIQLASSLIVATNVLLLASFVLSGFGAYLLAYDQLRGARGEGRGMHQPKSNVADATLRPSPLAPRPSPLLFSCRALCRHRLCGSLGQSFLCGPRPVQHCQQPVDTLLCAVPDPHGDRADTPRGHAGRASGWPLLDLSSLGRAHLRHFSDYLCRLAGSPGAW